jgi:tetraacyldisaccharide 4'-kinase
MQLLRYLLFPVSVIYAAVVFLRNRLYDAGVFKSRSGALPTIVIGNLATGGTGKTPFTEYLIRLIDKRFKIAVLSRGYRRKTSGFVLAGERSGAADLGDEPAQIHRKFPEVSLAVCEDRLQGILELRSRVKTELVLLDDAFQHRRLLPNLSILLTDYSRPFWKDLCLPSGYLRDNRFEKRRASIIVVTKCPPGLERTEKERIRESIQPSEEQLVLFSSLRYGQPYQISGPPLQSEKLRNIAGFAGLANTKAFEQHLRSGFDLVVFKKFADHHNFSPNDILKLWNECGNFAAALMTTEKDATKLIQLEGISGIPVFAVPVEIYLQDDEEKLLEKITSVMNKAVIEKRLEQK